MPPRVSWSLRDSNGKLHRKSPGIQAQSSSVEELGRRIFIVESFSDHGKEKIQEGQKIMRKRGGRLWIQGEILFSSEFLAEEDWGCRGSSNSNYFEMAEVNKMKSWNASRIWKWDLKLLKMLMFPWENGFLFYFKLNISAGIHEFLLSCTRYALMRWNIFINK